MKRKLIFFVFCLMCFKVFSKDLTKTYNSAREQIHDLFLGQAVILGNVELISDKEINDISLALLDDSELRLLRNAIYAKYGYIFSSEDLRSYFSQFDWYDPKNKNVDSFLSNIDKKNIDKIKLFEKNTPNGFANIELAQYYGEVWSKDIVVASAHNDRFIFEDSDHIRFQFRENISLKILYGFNGLYKISNGRLEIKIQELLIHFPDTKYEMNGINGIDWIENDYTKLILDRPLELFFPIEAIEKKAFHDLEVTSIKIGSEYYYLH